MFWHNTRTWQTPDGQTDRQTNAIWRHRPRLSRSNKPKQQMHAYFNTGYNLNYINIYKFYHCPSLYLFLYRRYSNPRPRASRQRVTEWVMRCFSLDLSNWLRSAFRLTRHVIKVSQVTRYARLHTIAETRRCSEDIQRLGRVAGRQWN